MVKSPEFDERPYFGASRTGPRLRAVEEIEIAVGTRVALVYKGKLTLIQVTKVLSPQSEFEGRIQSFDMHELEHEDLKAGDEVRFPYEKIAHIDD